ncbi:MAG TPA: purine-nucleoside phosphorylase [Rhodothermales bacterium]|nr:purine-nucleoside phosphorylase [Rhodothermales bacterium]
MFDPSRYRSDVDEAVRFIRERLPYQPATGLILGTGLGMLAGEIRDATSIDYEEIPHFPVSTVETHHGRLVTGTLEGHPVIALQGRFHLYEGYDAREITLPVRVLKLLGVERLLISNAAGGMNPHFARGDLMMITDHINLQGDNPLVGPNIDEWGPRFPDMSNPYDRKLRNSAQTAALTLGIQLREGVYVAVSGPNFETRAEYRFLRLIGADAVGMSTVPEVIVARHMGLPVLAISVITDECFPDALQPISVPEILAAAADAEPRLTAILKKVISGF